MSCANGPADSDSVNLGSNPSSPAIDVLGFFPISPQNSAGHLDVHLDDSVLFSSFFIALSPNAASLYR